MGECGIDFPMLYGNPNIVKKPTHAGNHIPRNKKNSTQLETKITRSTQRQLKERTCTHALQQFEGNLQINVD